MKTRQNELRSILERILQMAMLIFFTAILILPISVNCMAEEDEEEWHEDQKQGEEYIENYIVRTKPLVKQDGYTEEDVIKIAHIMWLESGCDLNLPNAEDGLKRQGQIVVNRVNSDVFPDTIDEVVYQTGQYGSRTVRLYGTQEITQQIPDIVYVWAREVLEGDFRGPDNMVYGDTQQHGKYCGSFGNTLFGTSDKIPVDENGRLILSGKATKSTEVKNTEAENQVVQTAVENVSVQSYNINSEKAKKVVDTTIEKKTSVQKGNSNKAQQIADTNVSNQVVMSERDLLAEIIFYEKCGFLGTPEAEQECKETGTIFVNRKNSDQYPNTFLDIISQEDEFSQWLVSSIGHQGDIPEVVYKWADEVLAGDVLGDYTSYHELEEMKRQEELNAIMHKHEDTQKLAQLMYAELKEYFNDANAELYFKMVGQVALNRKASNNFPNTLEEVIYQPGQYVEAAEKIGTQQVPKKVYEWANDLLEGESVAPENMIYASRNQNGILYDEWNGFYFGLEGENILEQEELQSNNISSISANNDDKVVNLEGCHPIDLLAKVMYTIYMKEGYDINTPYAEERCKAYGAMIMKRVKSENWPNTIWEVIDGSDDLYDVRMSKHFSNEQIPENINIWAEEIYNGEYETINVAYEPSSWHTSLIQETSEPVTEETTESITEDATEETTEPTTEPATEASTEAATEQTAEAATQETTTEGTTESVIKETIQIETQVATEEQTQLAKETSVKTQIVTQEVKSQVKEESADNSVNEIQEYSDVEYVAQVIFIDFLNKYFEDSKEYSENPDAEKYAKFVGQVVINRKNANICPNTIKEVIYQEGQYENVVAELSSYEIPEIVYQWANELLEGERVAPENLVYASENVNGEMYDAFNGFYFGTLDLSQYN